MAQLGNLITNGTARFLSKVYANDSINAPSFIENGSKLSDKYQPKGNYAAASHTHTTVNGHTVNADVPSGAKFTDTNTWRPLGTTADTACAGNDSRLSNARPASDVYAWAKASSKPSYTYSEVGAAASSHSHSGYATTTTTNSLQTQINTINSNLSNAITVERYNKQINGCSNGTENTLLSIDTDPNSLYIVTGQVRGQSPNIRLMTNLLFTKNNKDVILQQSTNEDLRGDTYPISPVAGAIKDTTKIFITASQKGASIANLDYFITVIKIKF